MKEVTGSIRQIHPDVISDIGIVAPVVLLEVANKLRSGEIEASKFNMKHVNDVRLVSGKFEPYCNTPCCIIGWARIISEDNNLLDNWPGGYKGSSPKLFKLFAAKNQSNPQLAADAIERYVYDYSSNPWQLQQYM